MSMPAKKTIWEQISAQGMLRLRLFVFAGLIVALAVLLIVGVGPDREIIEALFYTVKDSAFGLPVAVLVFWALGLIGTPQFLLIAASVFVFGPIAGSIYSWIGTMVSACSHFWFARWVGAEPLAKFGGKGFGKLISFVSKNGFWSALLVRVVPSGPFILVNLALGVSRARFMQFSVGTGIGIIPKILAIALVGQGLLSWAGQADGFRVLLFFGMAGLVMVAIWLLRGAWKRKENQVK